jgi:hypothetical protein
MGEFLNLLRGLVRPVLTLILVGTVAALAIILTLRYADAELANTLVTFLTASATMVLAFWFGERKSSK